MLRYQRYCIYEIFYCYLPRMTAGYDSKDIPRFVLNVLLNKYLYLLLAVLLKFLFFNLYSWMLQYS